MSVLRFQISQIAEKLKGIKAVFRCYQNNVCAMCDYRVVEIERGVGGSFGFCVIGGIDTELPPMICALVHNGSAQLSGKVSTARSQRSYTRVMLLLSSQSSFCNHNFEIEPTLAVTITRE